MKNKKTLLLLSLLFLTMILVIISCKKEASSEAGGALPPGKSEIKIMMTDDPSVIFDSIFLDIQRVEALGYTYHKSWGVQYPAF
jgi:hypothetical protein